MITAYNWSSKWLECRKWHRTWTKVHYSIVVQLYLLICLKGDIWVQSQLVVILVCHAWLTHPRSEEIGRRFNNTLEEEIQERIAVGLCNVQNQREIGQRANDPKNENHRTHETSSQATQAWRKSVYQQMIKMIVFFANRNPLNSDNMP